jgi:cadmium resistance protein CadD (predicted permease)
MEIVIASILAFASTNVDDIFVVILFYSNKKMRGSEIVIGQLGFTFCMKAEPSAFLNFSEQHFVSFRVQGLSTSFFIQHLFLVTPQ